MIAHELIKEIVKRDTNNPLPAGRGAFFREVALFPASFIAHHEFTS